MGTLTPLLKIKVDELFLQWLSSPETQRHLCEDLKHISTGHSPPSSPVLSSSSTVTNHGLLTLRPSSPPAPPPLSPMAIGKSPRSPRKKSSTVSKSSSLKKKRDGSLKFHYSKGRITPGCAKNMPQFFFPFGKPGEAEDKTALLFRGKPMKELFASFPEAKAAEKHFVDIVQLCGIPFYWKHPLYEFCRDRTGCSTISYFQFANAWKSVIGKYHSEESRLFHLISRGMDKPLKPEQLEGLVLDVINSHPGLLFLTEAPEFHSRYVTTVVARMFYVMNRSWSGTITLSEFKASNIVQVLANLEEEEDINQVMDYFSYEHFYVIYCKFWELDSDHDLVIDEKDMAHYCNGALTSKIISRLFSGCVTRGKLFAEGKMAYWDFVWFLLSEVDKRTPTSIDYWFRCMDLDGDGILSMYELEYFYLEQLARMEKVGIETLDFEDCLCSILDLVKPAVPGMITLRDIKRCKMSAVFFDTFLNLDRWLEHEQRDPFQMVRANAEGSAVVELSDWERFAAEEYEVLVAEEGTTQDLDYDDDFDEEEFHSDELSGSFDAEEKQSPWSYVKDILDDDDDEEEEGIFY